MLFVHQYFDALLAVDGDVGGRSVLIENDDSTRITIDNPGILRDVDTHADLQHQR